MPTNKLPDKNLAITKEPEATYKPQVDARDFAAMLIQRHPSEVSGYIMPPTFAMPPRVRLEGAEAVAEWSDGTQVRFDPAVPSGAVGAIGTTDAEGLTDVVLCRDDGRTVTAKVKITIDDEAFLREVARRARGQKQTEEGD